MIKAVFFDKDGVLIKSLKGNLIAFNLMLEHYGKQKLTREEYKEIVEGTYVEYAIKKLFKNILNKKVREMSDYFHQKRLDIVNKMRLYPNVVEVLRELKKRKLKLAVVSSTISSVMPGFLKYFKIDRYFDVVVAGDTVKKPKPAPDAILLACKKLNLKSEDVVYIGDNWQDVEAGKRAGCFTVAITNTSSRRELKNADKIIKNLNELPKLIDWFNKQLKS